MQISIRQFLFWGIFNFKRAGTWARVDGGIGQRFRNIVLLNVVLHHLGWIVTGSNDTGKDQAYILYKKVGVIGQN